MLLLGFLLASCSRDDTAGRSAESSTCARSSLKNPYFGDAHSHTKYSLDAGTQGTTLGPHEAYRFALGEKLGIQPHDANGRPLRELQLDRPLDFAVVTDHSEFFGEVELCTNPAADPVAYNSPECVLYRDEPDQAFLALNALLGLPANAVTVPLAEVARLPVCGPGSATCLEAAKTPWRDIQEAAAEFNQACHFTTFVGYEWTGSPSSSNLLRNVIFATEKVPPLPVSYFEAPEPELLWKKLAEQCSGDCDYLTIPHNSNLSSGLMFRDTDSEGRPFTRQYAADRARNEPLAEIFQHKGDSECFVLEEPGKNDELCAFEKLPFNNLAGERFGPALEQPPVARDFLRNALKDGLLHEQRLGVNPFKYGLIGSTDTHLGTPGATSESNFPGHGGAGSPARSSLPKGLTENIYYNPAGLAVVWAEENTRPALFEAMRRREVYGTSGTRILVRFFGDWQLPADMCGFSGEDFSKRGYGGAPMGGDMPALPASAGAPAPSFAVWAQMDPGGQRTPLQRIQIVKGWIAKQPSGEWTSHETVYDVAGTKDDGWRLDEATCRGAGASFTSLCTVWTDPDFDPADRAFYYARVVENPTCRWSTYQCLKAPATMDCSDPSTVPSEWAGCCDTHYPKTIQERAWTSPIWYEPRS